MFSQEIKKFVSTHCDDIKVCCRDDVANRCRVLTIEPNP